MNITNFSFSKNHEAKRVRPVIYVPERLDPIIMPRPINKKQTSPIGTIGSINKIDYCPTAKLNTTKLRFMADSYLGNLAFKDDVALPIITDPGHTHKRTSSLSFPDRLGFDSEYLVDKTKLYKNIITGKEHVSCLKRVLKTQKLIK